MKKYLSIPHMIDIIISPNIKNGRTSKGNNGSPIIGIIKINPINTPKNVHIALDNIFFI